MADQRGRPLLVSCPHSRPRPGEIPWRIYWGSGRCPWRCASLLYKLFSISCSFWEILGKNCMLAPAPPPPPHHHWEGWCRLLRGFLDQPLSYRGEIFHSLIFLVINHFREFVHFWTDLFDQSRANQTFWHQLPWKLLNKVSFALVVYWLNIIVQKYL